MTGKIVISILGPLRVTAPGGHDITPSSAKAQGLLLLLICGPSGVRTRRWLQDKLWSDRAPEQGGGSLRQTLTQIRKGFNAHRDAIRADRQRVWLDLDKIEIDQNSEGELAEGIDVRDQEFEAWLTIERARSQGPSAMPVPAPAIQNSAARPGDPVVLVELPKRGEVNDEWAQSLFADVVVRMMRESYSTRFVWSSGVPAASPSFKLRLESQQVSDKVVGFRAALTSAKDDALSWSDHRIVQSGQHAPLENPAVAELAWEIGEAFGDALLQHPEGLTDQHQADMLSRLGIRHLFTMREEDVEMADTLFAKALEHDPRGLYHAWRAQACTIQRIERHKKDLGALRAAGRYHVERGLELEARNSWVLALAANTHLFLLGEPATALEYAERAVSINAANPMAWWAVSSARLYCDAPQQAYEDALRGRNLASRSPYRFWWDLQLFAAAMMLGRVDEAVRLLESCVGQRPSFRPPFRYLAALRATMNSERLARSAIESLRSMETDFSVDRLLQDRDYPASLLHRAEAIDLKKVSKMLR